MKTASQHLTMCHTWKEGVTTAPTRANSLLSWCKAMNFNTVWCYETSQPQILLISVQRYASELLGWWAAKGTSKSIAEGGMAESLRQHGVAFHPPNLVAQELSPKMLLQETSPSSFSSKKNLAINKKRSQRDHCGNTIMTIHKNSTSRTSPSNSIVVTPWAPSKSQGSASVSTPQPSSNSRVNRGAGSWNTFLIRCLWRLFPWPKFCPQRKALAQLHWREAWSRAAAGPCPISSGWK